MVRQTLENEFNLPEGTLNSDEYKYPLNTTIAEAAVRSTQWLSSPSRLTASSQVEEMEPDVEAPTVHNTKKRKSEEVLEPKPRKKQNVRPQKPKKSSKEFKSSVRRYALSMALAELELSRFRPSFLPQMSRTMKLRMLKIPP